MKKKLLTGLITGSLMFCIVGMTQAAIINVSLGEYSSPYWTGTATEYNVGTFTFDLMGETVISASINGTWGNSASPTTAHNFLELDDIEIADTHDYSPSPYNTYYTPWSFTFSDFSIFNDGIAVLDVTQTTEYVVRLDDTYLTIETEANPVPEPATMLLMGAGLLGLVGYNRKRNKS